jgi:hypothetical protein
LVEIRNESGRLVLTDRTVVAAVDGPVRFGHMGCKCLRTVVEERKAKAREAAEVPGTEVPAALPEDLLRLWDNKNSEWRRAGKKGAATRVGKALGRAVECSGMSGVELWDTMRGGSDYWRPGKLLSQVERALKGSAAVSYAREDNLCPPSDLLEAFRCQRPEMPFAEYAEAYATWLLQDHHLDLALAAVIIAQARSRLAVFYCTDPFIPGYADRTDWLSDTPFSARRWPLSALLRNDGCHRVILAELLARRLRELGVAGYVLEVDPTREEATALPF